MNKQNANKRGQAEGDIQVNLFGGVDISTSAVVELILPELVIPYIRAPSPGGGLGVARTAIECAPPGKLVRETSNARSPERRMCEFNENRLRSFSEGPVLLLSYYSL